ncbi:Nup85 protein [Candida orthopsilosis Co 90-125]|uniref:Nuclear pore complex protein Nup85 n=1 Tax=Candida orthopsilosis (strain 90-125) TaxID=1136231 RepID=H8X3P4_CANO9|nr:Nup85 protein [Candida orthopsilosis Co 90-125]CCG25682.1 Nup85 protein [Candida orthopsilosis Co 90-125]
MSGLVDMNRDFKDIEMLDIPVEDDDDVDTTISSSETEGIVSDSPTSNEQVDKTSNYKEPLSDASTSSSLSNYFSSNTEYVPLSQYLDTDDVLSFHFDQDRYRASLEKQTPLDQKYITYVESDFRTVQKLAVNLKSAEDESLFQPIGVITSQNEMPQYSKSQIIDDAYDSIVDHLKSAFADKTEISNGDELGGKFNYLLITLECLRAACFNSDVRRVPELIVKWVNKFDPQPSPELIDEVMTTTPQPYAHPLFWNTLVSKTVCRGLFDQSYNILEHSQYKDLEGSEDDLFLAISNLKTLLSSYTPMALKGQFPQWKLSACQFRDDLALINISTTDDSARNFYQIMQSQIYDIACILTGFSRTIADYCENWYELYLAYSLYQIRDDESVYSEYFQQALKEQPPVFSSDQNECSDYDRLTESCLLKILEGRLLKALESIFNLDPATAAYVSLLLEYKGYLDSYYSNDIHRGNNLRDLFNKKKISEYFLLHHAYNCLNIHPLVPVGIGLLSDKRLNPSSKARERNKRIIAHFLPKYEIVFDGDQEWALTVCADLHLVSTAKDIYYQAGLRAFNRGFLYEALANFVDCYDPDKTSGAYHKEGLQQIQYIVWDVIFTDCIICNKPIQDELINNIVDQKVDLVIHPMIQQCISPYAVLKEFYDSLKAGRSDSSLLISKIVHLLNFNFLPEKFKPLLLCQFLPFLEGKSKLRQPDLFTIIELIEDYENDTNEQNKKDGEKLYAASVSHKEEEQLESYDWRRSSRIPNKFSEMIKLLRHQLTIQIGQNFIE